MTHNLENFKFYPTVHNWIVNRDVFSITTNTRIRYGDTLIYKGRKFTVISNYFNEKKQESTPQHITRENVLDNSLPFITKDSTYYEFLTELEQPLND